MRKLIWVFLSLAIASVCIACKGRQQNPGATAETPVTPPVANQEANNNINNGPQATVSATPVPQTNFPIGSIDFKNHTYPLPRGWQGPDMSDVKLENGIAQLSEKKIGASLAGIKYADVTGDGKDEALVILKIETGGSAIPQNVYIFSMRDKTPEMIWQFRTGDRADGGLKDVRAEGGQLLVELYGQDRFLFGEVETMKITGDEEQLCCPTFYTRSSYKWNGRNFLAQGKRLTFSVKDPAAPPVENMGDAIHRQQLKGKK